MITIDLGTAEKWREYDFNGRVYRIDNPRKVQISGPTGTTHRVTDATGIVHLVPSVGYLGCVVRFDGEVVA